MGKIKKSPANHYLGDDDICVYIDMCMKGLGPDLPGSGPDLHMHVCIHVYVYVCILVYLCRFL
jgi:hypothetical protein